MTGTVVSSTTNSTTTGTGSTVTAGSGTTGTFTGTVGTTYYLTETSPANYNSLITCVDSNGLQTGLPSGVALGAGFSGMAMGAKLKRAGRTDFVILERASDVGGVWRDNTYPGAACDVPSHMYSLSFAQNPAWSRTYSHQPEIHAYLQRVAREEGLLDHIRLDTELVDAQWQGDHWAELLRDSAAGQ